MRAEPYRSRIEEGWDITWEFGFDPYNFDQIICTGESEWLWDLPFYIYWICWILSKRKAVLGESWIYKKPLQPDATKIRGVIKIRVRACTLTNIYIKSANVLAW